VPNSGFLWNRSVKNEIDCFYGKAEPSSGIEEALVPLRTSMPEQKLRSLVLAIRATMGSKLSYG
jgi:hypothetical protein